MPSWPRWGSASVTRGPKPEPASRERLLDAAIELFGERGYAATGVGPICARAGLAKTALYHHFGSKENLLAFVIERIEGAWIEELQKQVYRERDVEQRIDVLLEGWAHIAQGSPHLWRLPIVAGIEQGDHSPRIREALAKVWSRAERALAEGIEDSVGRRLPELDLVAHTVISLLQAAMLKQIHMPDPERLSRELDELALTLKLLIWVRLPYDLQRRIHALGPPAASHGDVPETS